MNNLFWLFKKEFLEVIRDRRTIIYLFVIPVIGIPLILVFISNLIGPHYQKKPKVALKEFVNYEDIKKLLEKNGFEVILSQNPDSMVLNKKSNVGLSYEKDTFYIFYNMRSVKSLSKNLKIEKILSAYKAKKLDEFLKEKNLKIPDFLNFKLKKVPLFTKKGISETFFFLMVLYFVVIIIQSAMFPAIELVTGEKERKTLELLLSYPAKRIHLILSKLFVIFLFSFSSSFIATSIYFLIFPKVLMGMVPEKAKETFSIFFPPLSKIILLIIFMALLALLISSVEMIVASFARTFKEAQTLLQNSFLFVILPLFFFLFAVPEIKIYTAFIPLINFIYVFKLLFEGQKIFLIYYSISLIVNLLFFIIFLILLIRLFEREEILFRV